MPIDEKEEFRDKLRTAEDQVLKSLDQMQGDARWKQIARTHIEQGFMAWKRALFEGKRVGDK